MSPHFIQLKHRFSCVVCLLLLCSSYLGAHILLPIELVNNVGEEINFKIPTDEAASLYGANQLPPGLVLDAETGIVSGTILETGLYRVTFLMWHAESDHMHSAFVEWRIIEAGELSDYQVFTRVLEFDVGDDLSVYEWILFGDYEATQVGPLPDGVSYSIEQNRFSGGIATPGVYEIDFEQLIGPTTWYTKVVLVIKSQDNLTRLPLPFSSFVGMRFFNDQYYWVHMMGILTASDVFGSWDPVSLQPNGFLHDLELFQGKLIVAADGGVWVSEDGVNYQFTEIPNIQRVENIIPGPEGVFLECNAFSTAALYFSSDGINWKFVEDPVAGASWSSPFPNENRIVSVNDEFWMSVNDQFYVTTNGDSWSIKTTSGLETPLPFTGIQYGNGKVAFITENGAYFSEDLVEWDFVDLSPAYTWESLYFLGDRFYAVGLDKRKFHVLYSGTSDEDFVLVDLTGDFNYVHSLSVLNGILFLEDRSLNGSSNGVIALTGDSESTKIRVTPVIPFAADYPIFFPLDVVGEFDSVKAYGLPLGTTMDESKAIVSGIPRRELPRGKREAYFVPLKNGEPGVMSRVDYGVSLVGEEIPNFQTDYIYGSLGGALNRDTLRLSPWIGTDDKSSEITLSGNPNWLSYNPADQKLEGIPDSPYYGFFTAHGQNLYGETSKEIQLVVGSTAFEQLPYVVDSDYSTGHFSEGEGIVFSNSGLGLFWTDDFETWTESVPRIRTNNEVTYFNDRYYIYEDPNFLVSDDGKTWSLQAVTGVNSVEERSLFVVGDRMYLLSGEKLYFTLDGSSWEEVGGELPENSFVKYTGGYFFALAWGSARTIYRSTNAVTWELVAQAPYDMFDLVHGDGTYLVAMQNTYGTQSVFRSTDGEIWSEVVLSLEEDDVVQAIAFANSKFHLVTSKATYLNSDDGNQWNITPPPSGYYFQNLRLLDFVGGRLLASGNLGRLYQIRDPLPPVIEMPISQSFPLGQSLNVPIEVSGQATEFAVEGLPDGLELRGGRIVGIPMEEGPFRVSVVAFSGESISEPAIYHMNIYAGNPQASIREDPFFVAHDYQSTYLINTPFNYYEDWSLRSPDLPENLEIDGYGLRGNLDRGVYTFTLELRSESGEMIESKEVTLYVSDQIETSSSFEFYKMQAIRGIPFTETIVYEGQGPVSPLVTGITGLPPGLSYEAETKQVTGTPTESGTFLIEVSADGWTSPNYLKIEVSENFLLMDSPFGSYNADQEVYEFGVSLKNSGDMSFQWFYGEEELMDVVGFSGTTTSQLRVDNLPAFDPTRFNVLLTRGNETFRVDVPYLLGPDDYFLWAERVGLEGSSAEPDADGFGTGYPNLFAFLQGIENPREFQRPTLSRNGDFVSVRFKTTKDWRQEQLSVLFASDLGDERLVLRPKIVQQEPDYFVWESLANAGSDYSSFFYLSVEIAQ